MNKKTVQRKFRLKNGKVITREFKIEDREAIALQVAAPAEPAVDETVVDETNAADIESELPSDETIIAFDGTADAVSADELTASDEPEFEDASDDPDEFESE